MKIKQKKAAEMMQNSGGLIFGAKFFKRSDGSLRNGSFRTGVKKGMVGNPRYSPGNYNLLGVYDMNSGHRSIPLDRLISITIKGIVYSVEGGTK
jgi:hypothetical protein